MKNLLYLMFVLPLLFSCDGAQEEILLKGADGDVYRLFINNNGDLIKEFVKDSEFEEKSNKAWEEFKNNPAYNNLPEQMKSEDYFKSEFKSSYRSSESPQRVTSVSYDPEEDRKLDEPTTKSLN
jgi:hypothetical protein